MRVLLLSPPYLPGYMRNARCDFVSLSGSQWYPLLLGYCGAWLEQCGHTVKLLDAPAAQLDHAAAAALAREFAPDWIVLYTGRLSEQNDLDFGGQLAGALKARTVIVGPYAGIAPAETLGQAPWCDYLVTGEFELPVAELLAGNAPANVANLLHRDGDRLTRNPERPYLTGDQLDRIPPVSLFFARQLDLRHYHTPSEPFPFLDILTGRGCCWGRCTYCLWVNTYVRGPVYNQRSITNVIEELRALARDLPQVRSVMLQDDTFPDGRARAFSEAKLQAGLTLPWSCYARGDLSRATMLLMRRAGCLNLHVGFESADPGILAGIKKGLTRERMTQFADDARHAGLRIHGDFALGFPGETPASIAATIDWACALRPHTVQFQLMIPFRGTPYYDELQAQGWLKDGRPDYPQLDAAMLEQWAKRAYRRYYLSWPFLRQVLRHPRELLFSRLGLYRRALPALFWRRYIR